MKRGAVVCRLIGALICLAVALPGMAAERLVRQGGDLQAAIDAARPGDTILLEPGATFVGNFRLPVHGGTVPVTIRSAAPDSVLPRDGTRITPEHRSQLPTLRSPNAQPVISTAPGAAYWTLRCLELGPTRQGFYDIVALGDGTKAQNSAERAPHHLILDRLFIHGDETLGQKRGIALNSGHTEIRNSYISDIKAAGQDSQAIAGWNGPGPFVIENNYLEGAGEVIIFGGTDPGIRDLVPADIRITGNTITRPIAWRDAIVPAPAALRATRGTGGQMREGRHRYRVVARLALADGDATSPAAETVVDARAGDAVTLTWTPARGQTYRVYRQQESGNAWMSWAATGGTFTDTGAGGEPGAPPSPTVWQVKNLLELKNARRVLIERNDFSHNWDQAQSGGAILFTPRNQDGGCRWCVVEDVTFEANVVRGVGSGFTLLGRDDEHPSGQLNGIRIRNNIVTDVGGAWGSTGYFLLVMGGPRDVVVDHNTIVAPDAAGLVAADGPPVQGFVFTNNVARHNRYGIIGADKGIGTDAIRAYFPDGVITRNVLADNRERHAYPGGNEFPSAADFENQFVDHGRGNFALKPSSKWRGAGTDGRDLGAPPLR